MRLRNKPWAEPFLEENDDLVLKYSDELKDNYHNIFDNNESLNLEIGTGKGDFIKQLAKKCKDIIDKKTYNQGALNWKLSQ